MTEQLGPASRALLDAAREGMTPDPAAIARVKSKVGASVAGGAAVGVATKLTVLALVGVVAIGAIVVTRDRDEVGSEPRAPVVILEQPRAAPAAAPVVPAAPELQVETEMEPMIVAREKPRARKIDLAREVELLDTAMTALRRGDATAALTAARTHASETAGRGQLAEDASAIEIEALCRLGDTAAAAKLLAFDKRWPHSAQRTRITTACP